MFDCHRKTGTWIRGRGWSLVPGRKKNKKEASLDHLRLGPIRGLRAIKNHFSGEKMENRFEKTARGSITSRKGKELNFLTLLTIERELKI